MSTTNESLTQAEMVERCRLLSEDQKSYITNQAQFMRALIGQWEGLKLAETNIKLPEGAKLEDFFVSGLFDIIQNYEELMKVENMTMDRAAFLTVERVRRQLIIGMTDVHYQTSKTELITAQ